MAIALIGFIRIIRSADQTHMLTWCIPMNFWCEYATLFATTKQLKGVPYLTRNLASTRMLITLVPGSKSGSTILSLRTLLTVEVKNRP